MRFDCNLKKLEEGVFAECKSLEEFVVPEGVEEIKGQIERMQSLYSLK